MSNDDTAMRHTIRDMVNSAVSNEVAQQVAPLRERQQIHAGQLSQLNRDYGALKEIIERHDAVIIGNEALGMRGLIKQVAALDKAIIELNEKIGVWTNQIIGFRKALYVVAGLGAIGGIESLAKLFGLVP